jgi:5-oxoprolinase (ATP-hydrolysing) subunit A
MDLNGDVGESFGAYEIGHDAALIPILTSANIACGYHAGDPGIMRATVALAREHGAAVGAHPGFPDLVGFGRREIAATPREVEDLVAYQIGALAAIAAAQGVRLAHVKPHGALYNMAARDAALADAIARATAAVDRSLKLFGLPGSQSLEAARRHGVRPVSEAFADRAYRADGSLVPRSQPGAVIDDADTVVARAVTIARDRMVTAVDGTRVALDVETICVHGDTRGAAMIASRIRQALSSAGIQVKAPV